MSELAKSDAFTEFEQKWLDAWPENRVVAIFLDPALRRLTHAFATLIHELSIAAFRASEPQVAVAKLNWWVAELAGAAARNPRHPITQVLFADDRARAANPALWHALGAGAIAQLDQLSAGTWDELLRQFEPFHSAVARAEAALLCTAEVSDGFAIQRVRADATLWTLSHLLHAVPESLHSEGRLTLPLGLLARHGLTRAQLAQPSASRAALVKDFLADVEREIVAPRAAAALPLLGRRVRVQLDRALIAGAMQAADPVSYLVAQRRAGYWNSLWLAWREARKAARDSGIS